MSSISQDFPKISDEQRWTLNVIYEVFIATGGWPIFQYLDSKVWSERKCDPWEIYFELSVLGLVRPPVSREQSFRLREDTEVALTMRGLSELAVAEPDVNLFLSCIDYLARRADEFSPPAPTMVTGLEVTSAEIASVLGIESRDPALTRLGRLVQQAGSLWNSFSGPGEDGWALMVKLAEARRYVGIDSIGMYLQLQADDVDGRPDRPAANGGEHPSPAEPENSSPAEREPTPRERGEEHGQEKQEQQGDQKESLHFVRSVTADLPTNEDLLGFRPIVRALHGLLNDKSTVLPLAIAITAPWGTGKSSLMRQLQLALSHASDDQSAQRKWATVRFDAWKYEHGERLWAALAKAIYRQPQRNMSLWQRLAFRAKLQHQRRGWWPTLGMIAWPCLVITALVLAAHTVKLSGAGAVPAVVAVAAVTLGTLTRYGNALVNPFIRSIERYARRPDYEAKLGFTSDADRDIHVLTKLLAPDDGHGLAIFVDDLDRCSSAHLVEIIEAMNQIFNSASNRRCVFVLGLDREVVTTNINVAYASTVEQLREDHKQLGERFGLEFLAKLVQLSVSLPEPSPQALRTLLEAITGNAPDLVALGTQPVSDPDVARIQTDIQRASGDTLASVTDAAAQLTPAMAPSTVIAEAARRELAERIVDSPEVAQAEFAALPYLERNPRQIKRFHNAFRLQLYVANEDDKVQFDFTAAELVALAKWVVVRLRWPDLGTAIAQDPELLMIMEAAANAEPSTVNPALLEDGQLRQECDRWLARPGVRSVMVECDPSQRLSALELKKFLRVA
jgi:hypothetical protein